MAAARQNDVTSDKTPSIRENPNAARLPDFCNRGVWLRVLTAVNIGALVAALLMNHDLALLPREFAELCAFVEPVLLCSLTLLCLAQGGLAALTNHVALGLCVLVPMAVALALISLVAPLVDIQASVWRAVFWSALSAALLLAWLDLRRRGQSPAVTEARLMALTSRIRPHFLFNSLNAVLGVIRSDPKRAEAALEEMADLFRAVMKDSSDLMPLSDEIGLARQYLELEKLRLGSRLSVRWDIETCPPDALVPRLMLQPLLENAVYHGIEPLQGAGEITIRVTQHEDRVRFELTNPYDPGARHHIGNHMALSNIRERLALFFDLEARLVTTQRDGQYLVSIEFPYRKERRA